MVEKLSIYLKNSLREWITLGKVWMGWVAMQWTYLNSFLNANFLVCMIMIFMKNVSFFRQHLIFLLKKQLSYVVTYYYS